MEAVFKFCLLTGETIPFKFIYLFSVGSYLQVFKCPNECRFSLY